MTNEPVMFLKSGLQEIEFRATDNTGIIQFGFWRFHSQWSSTRTGFAIVIGELQNLKAAHIHVDTLQRCHVETWHSLLCSAILVLLPIMQWSLTLSACEAILIGFQVSVVSG